MHNMVGARIAERERLLRIRMIFTERTMDGLEALLFTVSMMQQSLGGVRTTVETVYFTMCPF